MEIGFCLGYQEGKKISDTDMFENMGLDADSGGH